MKMYANSLLLLLLSAAFFAVTYQQHSPEAQLKDVVASTEPKSNQNSTQTQDVVASTEPKSNVSIETRIPAGSDDDNQCECVPYYLCKNDSTINNNGEGIIDIRVEESSCGSYLDVCCNLEAKQEKPIPPPPVVRTGCGARNPFGVGFRITGDKDNEAQFGELPWMVAIIREERIEGHDELLNVYQCGGALIHPQVVLTAAHCATAKDKGYKIRAGEWDTQTAKEIFPYQDRDVQTIILHPEYYAGALFNDIALLFLESPVALAPNVDVICLPPKNIVIPAGTRCVASGWGKDVFGAEGKHQVILKRIDLPMVDRNVCQERLRKTRLGKHFQLDKSFVCAGGETGKDTCKGDGGSPLVCPIPGQNNKYQQVGIVSWGIGCGEEQIPGVYTNVPIFIEWINAQMSQQKLDVSVNQY